MTAERAREVEAKLLAQFPGDTFSLWPAYAYPAKRNPFRCRKCEHLEHKHEPAGCAGNAGICGCKPFQASAEPDPVIQHLNGCAECIVVCHLRANWSSTRVYHCDEAARLIRADPRNPLGPLQI